ncbi:MAG TPA: hypothetical protein PLG87_01295 [Treponemataceae bacterium]|jgi:tetratricopeptide (TPR) repeat protein|nr:hypothetical protein [Treponemataceae bacterium]
MSIPFDPGFDLKKMDDWQKADDLLALAWETDSVVQKKRLARQAMELNPKNIEAYYVLANAHSSFEKKEEFYLKGISLFKEQYDEEYFKENKGHFWGLLETRDFMRLQADYGFALWENGNREKAVQCLEELLNLNPNDNQGLRYSLVNWYLFLERYADALKIIKDYKEDTACMQYSSLFLAIKQKKTDKEIQKQFDRAVGANPHVIPFLIHLQELPAETADSYGYGDESEAEMYCFDAMELWDNDEDAQKKLIELVDALIDEEDLE